MWDLPVLHQLQKIYWVFPFIMQKQKIVWILLHILVRAEANLGFPGIIGTIPHFHDPSAFFTEEVMVKKVGLGSNPCT
jgi:hypothetical protein